jgi:hypothetical protein
MKWRFALLAAAGLVGCAPSHVYVRPQVNDVVVDRQVGVVVGVVRVPDIGAGGLDVRVSSTGAFRSRDEISPSVALPITIEVLNRSDETWAGFDPRNVTLSSATHYDLSPITSGVADTYVPIAPGAKKTFNLEFVTRATGDPRKLTPFGLRLVFRYGVTDYPIVIPFTRSPHPYYSRYGYPYYYPYYWDPEYGWRPGYYESWEW